MSKLFECQKTLDISLKQGTKHHLMETKLKYPFQNVIIFKFFCLTKMNNLYTIETTKENY